MEWRLSGSTVTPPGRAPTQIHESGPAFGRPRPPGPALGKLEVDLEPRPGPIAGGVTRPDSEAQAQTDCATSLDPRPPSQRRHYAVITVIARPLPGFGEGPGPSRPRPTSRAITGKRLAGLRPPCR